MKPVIHLIVSLVIGLTGVFVVKSIYILPLAVLFGAIIDFDHYLEFISTEGWKSALNMNDFYNSRHFLKSNRMIVLFHAWEYVLIFFFLVLFFNFDGIILFTFLAYSSHIILDQIGNYDIKPFFYFISYRIKNRFERTRIIKPEYLETTGDDRNNVKKAIHFTSTYFDKSQ